jgi:hypothetical protein
VPVESLRAILQTCRKDDLIDLAIAEGLAGPASEGLAPFFSESQLARLTQEVNDETKLHRAYLGLIEKIASAFDQAAIPWVLYKGPVLRELSYVGNRRSYADLDLLVSPRELRAASQILGSLDIASNEADWAELSQTAKGELQLGICGSPFVLLHWHLVWHRGTRQRLMLPTDELLERRRRLQLGSITVWGLDPTDFAIHIALYAAYTPTLRLRALLDIEQLAANSPPDWDALVERCHRWQIALPVGASLNCAVNTLSADIPTDVVDRLIQGPWQSLTIKALDRWAPRRNFPLKISVRAGLSRSLRNNVRATSVDFVAEAIQRVSVATGLSKLSAIDPAPMRRDVALSHPDFETYARVVDGSDRFGHISKRKIRQLMTYAD